MGSDDQGHVLRLTEYHLIVGHLFPRRGPNPDEFIGPFDGAAQLHRFVTKWHLTSPLIHVVEGPTPQGPTTMTPSEAERYFASRDFSPG